MLRYLQTYHQAQGLMRTWQPQWSLKSAEERRLKCMDKMLIESAQILMPLKTL